MTLESDTFSNVKLAFGTKHGNNRLKFYCLNGPTLTVKINELNGFTRNENSYLYHKARKCYFASASTVCGAEAPAEAALVRALAKHFLVV
jgi:hypothetical protein